METKQYLFQPEVTYEATLWRCCGVDEWRAQEDDKCGGDDLGRNGADRQNEDEAAGFLRIGPLLEGPSKLGNCEGDFGPPSIQTSIAVFEKRNKKLLR